MKDRIARRLGFAGREKLLQTIPGSLPGNTKTSTIKDHRPRVLSICDARRADCKGWYFNIYFKYKIASSDYRDGKPSVVFPPGTYPPHLPSNLKVAA